MSKTNLSRILLTKPFGAFAPAEFYTYVHSLYIHPPVKIPRIKVPKQILLHDYDAPTKSCLRCGKKVKKPTAKCAAKTPATKDLTISIEPA